MCAELLQVIKNNVIYINAENMHLFKELWMWRPETLVTGFN